MDDTLVERIAAYCDVHLDLAQIPGLDNYGYAHLPLCVIDAVYSIGARYSSTRQTVERFCRYFDLSSVGPVPALPPAQQLSVEQLLLWYARHGLEMMATNVYQNRQRTSPRNGILKAEAVRRFAEVLYQHGVNYREDVIRVEGKAEFEAQIFAIPGQRSGISLRYFYMLAGNTEQVKPDRMVLRFLHAATSTWLSPEASAQLLQAACDELRQRHPQLTLRALDHAIWQHQRTRT